MCNTSFSFLILVALLSSCTISIEPSKNTAKYFDIAQLIKDEIEQLENENFTLLKVMETEEEIDTLVIQNPEWQKELQIFAATNINRPALIGSYNIDTLENIINYTATSNKVKIESVKIKYKNLKTEAIEKVEIIKRNDNFINSSNQKLQYWPNEKYTIEAEQKLQFSQINSFKLTGFFQAADKN